MAVPVSFRNQFTSLETSGRAKPVPRTCVRCGTGISRQGGKRMCAPCYDVNYREKLAERRKAKP